ncbi:GNAT family N-acetyltransferase [Breznakiella homolactica]|uniref:GNAT family N-acetyltransferase n=1 Tax=Breznakiella homolactica TaxID=2798577 RepID=A0A7T7XLT0_9SPIR|nr:GNAT family N-acetyltransferase [Breznakiella homolactica]QQO08759.1 GNAT family N-acetyltransferase [Breznakiella homolactica]
MEQKTMNNIGKVRAAVGYIENHLTEKLDLETIARGLRYSKYHLHRCFSETLGVTIGDYLQRRRLTEAARRLVFTNEPIIGVALEAGYESQQAFSAAFKSMYKYPPNRFREAGIFYPLQLALDLDENLAAFPPDDAAFERRITFALEEDIPRWMELVRLVADAFPFLDEDEHRRTAEYCIRKKQAFILKEGSRAAGIMIFFRDTGSIGFLGVHPLCRGRGIARAFLDKTMDELLPDRSTITTTTYRAGDKADRGSRTALERLGFTQGELLTEFGYPTQRFSISSRPRNMRQFHG